MLQQSLPFTVLKLECFIQHIMTTFKLQQSLPFTVLKPYNINIANSFYYTKLQQSLPFTVLKP